MRAVPAAPALRPVAGVELAGRLARRGVAKNDRIDPELTTFVMSIVRARGRRLRAVAPSRSRQNSVAISALNSSGCVNRRSVILYQAA